MFTQSDAFFSLPCINCCLSTTKETVLLVSMSFSPLHFQVHCQLLSNRAFDFDSKLSERECAWSETVLFWNIVRFILHLTSAATL